MLDKEKIKLISMLEKSQQETLSKMIYYFTFLNWLKENNIENKMQKD